MAADFAIAPFSAADVKQSIAISLSTLLLGKEHFKSVLFNPFPF
jgi:hypothetical protein